MIARSIRGLFAATALMTVAATGVQAQEATKGIGATAGVALPMGDFGDIAGLGFHIGGQYAMPLQNALGLRFNLDYGRYGLENNVDGNTSLLGGVVNLTFNIETGTGLKPYIFGGLGFYNTKIEIDGFGSDDSSDMALNFGAGYNFAMGGKSLFTEVRYLSIQGDGGNLNTLPIVIGLRF